jgi:hypothetical protein
VTESEFQLVWTGFHACSVAGLDACSKGLGGGTCMMIWLCIPLTHHVGEVLDWWPCTRCSQRSQRCEALLSDVWAFIIIRAEYPPHSGSCA